jgi:hypothetical protein
MKRIATTLLISLALLPLPLAGVAQALTWDECGCRPDDPTFDNGPPISRMLDAQVTRRLKITPVGTLADYYCRTSIEWPQSTGGVLEGSGGYTYAYSNPTIGATRIVWAGEAGKPMIVYRGSGGRIGRLILAGGPLTNDYSRVAGDGIVVAAHSEPPSGNLITEQLAITQCVRGLHYLNVPDNDHADLAKHFGLLIDRCDIAYQVDGDQSCPHLLCLFDLRGGYKTAFKFDRGGALHVFGMYAGSTNGGTILSVGRSNDYVGDYEINGLQVDGAAKNLVLLEHGSYLFRARFNGGNIGKPEMLASPFVVAREKVEFADVKIDMRNAQYQSDVRHGIAKKVQK